MSFVHLHNHTHYSLLDGLTKIDEMLEFAKNQGSPAIAITDHGNMYGVIEFYQKAKKMGIKPIIGVEAYLAPRSRFDKTSNEDAKSFHLLLLAKNNQGYKNLLALVSAAHLEGFYYKPRIDWELLTKYHEGLIASTACLAGEIPRLIVAGQMAEAEQKIIAYRDLFGEGNFYLELMDHPEIKELALVNETLIEFSKKLSVPLLATNDVHYFRKEDEDAQDILLCIQSKKKLSDTDRFRMKGSGDYSLRSNADMISAFSHIPEAIENTLVVAEKCNVEIELGKTKLPYFPVPAPNDGNSYLRSWCEKNINKRYPQANEEELTQVKERLDYELDVIARMGWPSYFLIVADLVNWAKERKIVVGPGRGSAAGSIVCYLTDITNIDPLKYELLFERFLNPDRISMPDIDLDFADARRNEVLLYVADKYGHDHVAQIITFGTMAARAAVRDVGRVLGAPYEYCDKISKSIPMFTKLEPALKAVPELREMYQNEAMAKQIIDYAMRLEGVARHVSTHACGVLITDAPLTEYVPLQRASSADETIISQYSLHPIEDLGLLKMDFLGLKNLSIIESALKIIKNTRNLEIDIDKIPLVDELTYQLFQKGETTGIFQFESSGMKRYLRELKPSVFEDLIAMVALYRPGPMEWIPDYIAGKQAKKKVSYLHPKLEGILNKTYGVAIYQEQVMQIARDLAGFSMGQADVLRKAMGKKIPSLLAEQKERFVDGCVKNGVYKELAEQVFSFIEPFAGYGFNRSHAACYALIAYQTAYLKAHWPVEFMAALLTADQADNDRIAIEIEECRNMGIKIMAPDINESFASFTVVTAGTKDNQAVDPEAKLDTIRFGLKAIKNVGEHIVEELISERKKNGAYQDIFDLLKRVTDKDLNKKSLESLIKSGALDDFGERGELLFNLDKLLNYNKEEVRKLTSQQGDLFAGLSQDSGPSWQLEPSLPASSSEKLAWEKELLGLYVSEHPFNFYKEQLDGYALSIASLASHRQDPIVITAGIISSIKKIVTRKGDSMLFVKLEDAVSSIELLIFPKLYQETMEYYEEGRPLLVAGKISDKDQDLKLLTDKVGVIDSASPQLSIDAFKKELLAFKTTRQNGYYNYRNKSNGYSASNNKSTNASIKPVAPTVNKPDLKPDSKNDSGSKDKEVSVFPLSLKKPLSSKEIKRLREILEDYSGEDEVWLRLIEAGKYKIVKTDIKVKSNPALIVALKKEFGDKIELRVEK